jgi:hypothetical protein
MTIRAPSAFTSASLASTSSSSAAFTAARLSQLLTVPEGTPNAAPAFSAPTDRARRITSRRVAESHGSFRPPEFFRILTAAPPSSPLRPPPREAALPPEDPRRQIGNSLLAWATRPPGQLGPRLSTGRTLPTTQAAAIELGWGGSRPDPPICHGHHGHGHPPSCGGRAPMRALTDHTVGPGTYEEHASHSP